MAKPKSPGNTSHIDQADNVPLYLRVANSLRSRIYNEEWLPDTKLPTIKELADEYGVALVTARQAVGLLSSDDLVVSQRGKGTFVKQSRSHAKSLPSLGPAISDRLELPKNCSVKILKKSVVDSIPLPSGLSSGAFFDEYVRIEKLHLASGQPFAYMNLYVEKELFARVPEGKEKEAKVLKLILMGGPLKLSRNYMRIALAYADDSLASALKCTPLAALVRIRTIREDEEGRVIMVTDAFYRGDTFIYEIEESDLDFASISDMVLPSLKT